MHAAPQMDACPLCGGPMHDSTGGCNTCPMHSGCRMLCCAHCGYTTVTPESATVNFFKRLFGRRHRENRASRIPGAAQRRDPRADLV